MNEDELREKIYEHLGLDVGSLSSESGNDWQRAKKEVLDEFRRTSLAQSQETVITAKYDDIDELIANKNLGILYQLASKDLSEDEFQKLVDLNDKDILIRIASNTSITNLIAGELIGTVYLVHKALLMNPSVEDDIKQRLLERLKQMPSMYQSLIEQYVDDKL